MKYIFLILLCSIQAFAEVDSYLAPIVRNNKSQLLLVYNFWSGEYPMPVVDVNSQVTGETTIQGYLTLRDLRKENQKKCTINNGIYHPWAQKKSKSLLEFYSIVPNTKYTVLESYDWSDILDLQTQKKLKVKSVLNDTIDSVSYLAEGLCQFKLHQKNKIFQIEESCGILEDVKKFKKISQDSEIKEQWMYLLCKEIDPNKKALKIFVKDSDLLTQPMIKSGCILSFGHVGVGQQCEQVNTGS